jgi:hypothetical protein
MTYENHCGALINGASVLCHTRSYFHSCIQVSIVLEPNVPSPAFSKQVVSLLSCNAIVCPYSFMLTKSIASLDRPVRRHRPHMQSVVFLWL